MEGWLCETVGFSADRAWLLAKSFAEAGLVNLEDFYSSSSSKKNWLEVLNVEIEEWEAVSLASAISMITRGVSLVSQDPGFQQTRSGNSLRFTSLSPSDYEEITNDILSCERNPAYAILVCVKLLYSGLHVSYDLLCDFLQCLASGCRNSVVNQQVCMTTWENLLNTSRNLDTSGANREKMTSMQEMISSVYSAHASPAAALAPHKYEFLLNSDASVDSRSASNDKYVLLTLINVLLRSKYTPLLVSTYSLLAALLHQQPSHQHAICTAELLDTLTTHLQAYSMQLPLVSKIAMLLELLIFRNAENCRRLLEHQAGRLLALLAQYYAPDSLVMYMKHGHEDLFSSFMIHVLSIYINVTENEEDIDSSCLAHLMNVMDTIGDKHVLLTESFVQLVLCLLKASLRDREGVVSTDLVVHQATSNGSKFFAFLKLMHQHQLLGYLLHVISTSASQSNQLYECSVTSVNLILSDVSLFWPVDDISSSSSRSSSGGDKLELDVQLLLALLKCYIELLSKEAYTYYDHYSVFIEMFQSCHQLLTLYQVYIENKYPKPPNEVYVYDPDDSANPLDRHLLYYHFLYTKALLLILTHVVLKKFPVNAKYSDEIVCIYCSYLSIIRVLLRNCSEVYVSLCKDIYTNVVLVRDTLYLDTHITSAVVVNDSKIEGDLVFQAIVTIANTLYFQYSSLHNSLSSLPSSLDSHYKLGNLLANLCVHFFQDKALLGVFMNHSSGVFKMLIVFLAKSYAYNFVQKDFPANSFHFACILQCLQHGPASLLNSPNYPLCSLYLQLVQFMHEHLNDVDPSHSNALFTSYTYCLQGVRALCSHSVHIKMLLDDLHIEHVLLGMLVKMNALRSVSSHHQPADSSHRHASEEVKLAEGLHNSSVRLGGGQSSPNSKKIAKRVSFIDTDSSSLVIAIPQDALVLAIKAEDKDAIPSELFSSDQLHAIMSLIIMCLSNICHEHNFVYTSCLVKGGVVKHAIQCLQAYGKESKEVTLACLELCGHLAVDHKISLGAYGMCEAISDVFCFYVPLVEIDASCQLQEDDVFALDEHLVSVLCKTIYVLCDSYAANKARMKDYEHGKVLRALQLLIGKYYALISNPVRADVTDALNVIKFVF